MWVKHRSMTFWYESVQANWSSEDWIVNFRMTSAAFASLCVQLKPYVEKKSTSYRDYIPVPVRVGISLYFLCCSAECRTISNLFRVGLSTVSAIVIQVCKAIALHLLPHYIRLLTAEEIPSVIIVLQKSCSTVGILLGKLIHFYVFAGKMKYICWETILKFPS